MYVCKWLHMYRYIYICAEKRNAIELCGHMLNLSTYIHTLSIDFLNGYESGVPVGPSDAVKQHWYKES